MAYLQLTINKLYKTSIPMTDANSIEIFSILDEFCKYFAPELGKHTLDTSGKRRRNRLCLMSDSEAMTILVQNVFAEQSTCCFRF